LETFLIVLERALSHVEVGLDIVSLVTAFLDSSEFIPSEMGGSSFRVSYGFRGNFFLN